MTSLIVLSILLVSAPATAAEPRPPSPCDPPRPAPARPPQPPARPRLDFPTVTRSLVTVTDSNDTQVPGFGVSELGHIVTAARPLANQPSYLVSNAEGRVFPADRLAVDQAAGVMLLKLSGTGHGVAGLSFARADPLATAPLIAVSFSPSGPDRFTPITGTVTHLTAAGSGFITHNALFSRESAGAPLLNRCYQAVGVNVLQRQGVFLRQLDPRQHGSARSLSLAPVGRLLASVKLSLPLVKTECPSLEEETRWRVAQTRQEQAQALQRERAAAERAARQSEAALQRERAAAAQRVRQARQEQEAALRQAQQEKEAAEQATRAAEQRAREAAAALQQKNEEAGRAAQERAAAERAAQEREAALQRDREAAERLEWEARQQQRRTLRYASMIGGLLLLGILGALRSKRRRLRAAEAATRRMQSALSEVSARDQLRSSTPDVFLEGTRPPVALKIPGASLVDQPGAIVGRSPLESSFVINHEQISRRHFRLFLDSGQIMIEDLGSTNGTQVNGSLVEPGQPQPLDDASRLQLGDLDLSVRIDG